MGNIDINVFNIIEELPLIDYNLIRNELINTPEGKFLESMLDDDYDKNIRVERRNQLVWRDLQIIRRLKQKYECKCQICGYRFQKDNGEYYCEAHHIVPVAEDGSQSPDNVIILCANHHRMFHYAKNSVDIGPLIDGIREIKIGDEYYNVQF